MRFTSLALALSALTAVSASTAAALSQNNADAQLVARSGQAPGDSFDFSASRMTKRQIVQNNLKQRKHKRSTGNCKPISSPSQIPSDTPVLVADPSKGSEQSSQPQSSSKPQESTKQPESTKQAEPTKQAQSTNNDNNNNNNNGGGNSGSADAKLGGVSAFQGQNGPGILSWFYTNHAGDSTNGASWCQTSYKVGATNC